MSHTTPHQPTFIWAHRGASGYETENTLDAFELAVDQGADGLESDVQITKDQQLVFSHDYAVKWKDRKVAIPKLTYEQISIIRLENDHRIPLVKDVFEYFRDRKTQAGQPVRYSLDVALIWNGTPLINLAEKMGVLPMLELSPDDIWPHFWRMIAKFRRLNPQLEIIDSVHFEVEHLRRLMGLMYYQNWNKLRDYRVKTINLPLEALTDWRLQEIRDHGFEAYVWLCNEDPIIYQMCQLGIDAIYTDFPDRAVKMRDSILH